MLPETKHFQSIRGQKKVASAKMHVIKEGASIVFS
jgi:hypothetical protein